MKHHNKNPFSKIAFLRSERSMHAAQVLPSYTYDILLTMCRAQSSLKKKPKSHQDQREWEEEEEEHPSSIEAKILHNERAMMPCDGERKGNFRSEHGCLGSLTV